MAVSSMTGYASKNGVSHHIGWLWELRSVNGKGLDMRLRLPTGYEALEPSCRKICATYFARGHMQITLSVTEQHSTNEMVVDDKVLAQITKIADELAAGGSWQPASVDGLLGLKGVLVEQKMEISPDIKQEIKSAIMDGFEAALSDLKTTREAEGQALADILLDQIHAIDGLVKTLRDDPSRSKQAILSKLRKQVSELIESAPQLDETRLYQEAALLATKADLQEEIDRLIAHIASVKQIVSEGGPIGRRLDFIAQEFNRESNTVCSKSNATSVTQIGLDLKILIDQFREQIQNVE